MKLTFEEQSKLDNAEYWEKYSKWWGNSNKKEENNKETS